MWHTPAWNRPKLEASSKQFSPRQDLFPDVARFSIHVVTLKQSILGRKTTCTSLMEDAVSHMPTTSRQFSIIVEYKLISITNCIVPFQLKITSMMKAFHLLWISGQLDDIEILQVTWLGKTLTPSPQSKHTSCHQQWHVGNKIVLLQNVHFLTGVTG